jgi:hypothetical protein
MHTLIAIIFSSFIIGATLITSISSTLHFLTNKMHYSSDLHSLTPPYLFCPPQTMTYNPFSFLPPTNPNLNPLSPPSLQITRNTRRCSQSAAAHDPLHLRWLGRGSGDGIIQKSGSHAARRAPSSLARTTHIGRGYGNTVNDFTQLQSNRAETSQRNYELFLKLRLPFMNQLFFFLRLPFMNQLFLFFFAFAIYESIVFFFFFLRF